MSDYRVPKRSSSCQRALHLHGKPCKLPFSTQVLDGMHETSTPDDIIFWYFVHGNNFPGFIFDQSFNFYLFGCRKLTCSGSSGLIYSVIEGREREFGAKRERKILVWMWILGLWPQIRGFRWKAQGIGLYVPFVFWIVINCSWTCITANDETKVWPCVQETLLPRRQVGRSYRRPEVSVSSMRLALFFRR